MSKIGIDVDGVVSDFGALWISTLKEKYGPPLQRTPPVTFEDTSSGYSLQEVHDARDVVLSIPNAWSTLKPLSSFSAEVRYLLLEAHSRHDVWFITTRFDTPGVSPLKQTKHWLCRETLMQAPNVIIAKEKGIVATMLQLDAFIDDTPKNCISVKEARPTAQVFLADLWHNKSFSDPRIPRVADLKEFLKLMLEAN